MKRSPNAKQRVKSSFLFFSYVFLVSSAMRHHLGFYVFTLLFPYGGIN